MSKKIGVMVGSLRAESFNKKAAKAIVELLPQDFEVEFLEIGNLPFYNEEFDVETPEIIEKFREKITEKDGFIIFTPEYNRSVAPALKNAIDIATRPWRHNLWIGKKIAVGSASISGTSALRSNYEMRTILTFLGAEVLSQPELMLGAVQNIFDENGNVIESSKPFFQAFADGFINLFNK